MHLYNSENADWIPESSLKFLVKDGAEKYFNNVETTMEALTIDEAALPITINETEYQNSYVCSPYTHFVTYAYDQIKQLKNPNARKLFRFLVKIMDLFLRRTSLNKVVMVNNWLLSTILYPKLSSEQVSKITTFLTKRYPDHSILFRCINESQPDGCFAAMKDNSYDLIPCRIVYMTDTTDSYFSKARMFASDLKLLKKSPYHVLRHEDIPTDQVLRLKELYDLLNLEKYSMVNPQYNEDFIRLALKEKLLTFIGLEKDGQIDGIVGYYEKNGVMTCPLFGYDTTADLDLGLYRQLSTLLLLEAKDKGLILNGSGGAGSFKKLRRAKPVFEYYGVYTGHLSFSRRLPWKILKFLMNKIGVRVMEYFEK